MMDKKPKRYVCDSWREYCGRCGTNTLHVILEDKEAEADAAYAAREDANMGGDGWLDYAPFSVCVPCLAADLLAYDVWAGVEVESE